MSVATQCKFFGHVIDIEKALAIRDAALPEHKNSLLFQCEKCGKPVRPRPAGDKHVAHFVHVSDNKDCFYRDPPRDY